MVKINKSKTYNLQTGCGELNIIINIDNKNHRPNKIFIKGSKFGGCKASQAAIESLVCSMLKLDLVDQVINDLQGISCNSCLKINAKASKDDLKNLPLSCGDAVARVLQKEIEFMKVKK